jgi:predicted nucleic acid-binding protein
MLTNLPPKSPMREIVINTGPIIALVAATGSLEWLAGIYDSVWVPHEVDAEIRAGGAGLPESEQLMRASNVVQVLPSLTSISRVLANELDSGEASVIQSALEKNVTTVAIDEKAGRRVARLNGLSVTGTLGILIKARNQGLVGSLSHCIHQMRIKGIWISESLVRCSLAAVGEPEEMPDGKS